MLQRKKFPDIPDSTGEEGRESRPHTEEPRFCLIALEEGSFPCVVGKVFPAFPSHLKRRRSPLTTGTSGTRSGGLRKGQSPCELLRGLSGFFSRRCRGLRPCVEWMPEPEHSNPVLTRILGYFWSLLSGVSPRLEWGHAPALSSRAVAALSPFPSRGSRDQGLSLEAFPRGFPKRLSHRALPRATVV